ncbi:MAG: hypothetical protein OXF07_00505, partial [Rhodobacter sp.]|nr:hypothetical protein [Rhodobacter sp.]
HGDGLNDGADDTNAMPDKAPGTWRTDMAPEIPAVTSSSLRTVGEVRSRTGRPARFRAIHSGKAYGLE